MKNKTIRILFPQWQGGNPELYGFGARLLAWLAPHSSAPQFEIPVPDFKDDTPEPEAGLIYRQQLLRQYDEAQALLQRENPDRVMIFDGDCLVDQVPFAWLKKNMTVNWGCCGLILTLMSKHPLSIQMGTPWCLEIF